MAARLSRRAGRLGYRLMALQPGSWLGQYEILGHIGSGGMGEVYHARDSKLNREVALKLLPEHFARDPERILRFRREAQLLAQLNHPNIALLYNFEETPSARFLVMEYVPGPTLGERIKRPSTSLGAGGPVPIEEALRIAKQIAAALEHAHEKPIIHRDLKPANVKVTPEGQVKVLDFGLAKAFAGAAQPVDPNDIPTGSQRGTLSGTILGTPAYMSPEQARGKETDKRTDIWSFGCVLYELLTGHWVFQSPDQSRDRKRAAHPSPDRKGGGQGFPPDTVADILGAVLHKEPDWTALPPETPPAIRTLLRRCLEKDAAERFRDAADIRLQIQEAASDSRTATLTLAPPRASLTRRRALTLSLAALLIGAVLAGLAAWTLKPAPPLPVSRFTITLPPGQRLASLERPTVALSPDGSQLAYAAIAGGSQQLYLRAMDSLEAKPLPGTEGAVSPFFSPDGQWVGFFAGANLKKISVSGGAPITLTGGGTFLGASWGSRGSIAFSATYAVPTQQISEEGGTPQPLTRLEKGEASHRWAEFLPGGKAVLFAASAVTGNWINAQVVVHSVETGERRNLIRGGTHPRFAPTGHVLYAQSGTLMAVPFDPQRLAATGPAVPVLEGIYQSPSTGAAQYSLSAAGSLVYVAGGIQSSQRRLLWVSRNGAEQPLAAPARAYRNPRISPDGRRVAVGIEEQESQIWLYDIMRDTLARLTFEGNDNYNPAWTPDGKRIAFEADRANLHGVSWQLADGSGGLEQLTTSENLQAPNSWSPDGQLLALIEITPNTGRDILILQLSDPSASSPRPSSGQAGQARKTQPFLRTQYDEGAPAFSLDGRWLAYSTDESGWREIYVQPYPGPGGKWLISTEGGAEPMWNPNGRELFYRSGDKMMAVDVTTQPSFSPGKPRMLFEGVYQPTVGSFPNYDVSPDGQRFLMLKPSEQAAAPTQIHVVLNWFEELKRRAPAGR